MKKQRVELPAAILCALLTQETLASCSVAWHVARTKKAHSTGKKLIKPAAMDRVHIMCGDDVAKKDAVPLFINTVGWRIASVSANVKEQLISSIKQSGV